MKMTVMTLTVGTILLVGCESKAGTGALVGGAAGVGAGALISPTPQGALIGGAVGAATGAIIGASLDSDDREVMEQKSPDTVKRIDDGEQLTTDDIKKMSQNGLSDNVIIGQIQATNSVYYLSTNEIIDLKNAGVSQRVIDYMIQTGNR
ncbi:MAG: hypothetical protein JSR39_10545 [Verrucomicrobia bacterium]|nr:hypothetical protein [Verrucomicrobiota bacterium]